MAPPGFCNRGEVRYGSIGGLEYEVPQSRLYCLCINRGSLLDGLAMYLSCDRTKFHDNESTHILHNFWTSTHRGEASPAFPLASPLTREMPVKSNGVWGQPVNCQHFINTNQYLWLSRLVAL